MVYSNSLCSSAFNLPFDVLFVFRMAWWPSAGKELFACAVLLDAILIVFVFPFGVWGRMWNF